MSECLGKVRGNMGRKEAEKVGLHIYVPSGISNLGRLYCGTGEE